MFFHLLGWDNRCLLRGKNCSYNEIPFRWKTNHAKRFRVFLLSPQQIRQLCRRGCLHSPGHPATAVVLRDAIKESHRFVKRLSKYFGKWYELKQRFVYAMYGWIKCMVCYIKMKGYRLQAVIFHCRLQAQWAKKQSSSGATEVKRKMHFNFFLVRRYWRVKVSCMKWSEYCKILTNL